MAKYPLRAKRSTARSRLTELGRHAEQSWLRFWFGVTDARIYAAIRIAFAIVVLINIVEIWPYRAALLSRDGMIDLATLRAAIGDNHYYSLFHTIDSQSAVTLICALGAAAACALGLGILPRLSAIIIWIWCVSFSHRAFPALLGWDTVVRVYAFLIMISPLGKQWNVVAHLRRKKDRPQTTATAPQYGLQLMRLQLTVIYFNTVWSKLDDPYWRSGELFAYFMRSFYSRFPDFDWENHMIVSCLLTYGTLAIEASVPILLWINKTRWLGCSLGCSLHIGIAILARFSVFSLTIMAMYLSFLNTQSVRSISTWWHGDLLSIDGAKSEKTPKKKRATRAGARPPAVN